MLRNDEGALEHALGYEPDGDGPLTGVPDGLTQVAGYSYAGCYEDSFAVIAACPAGNYYTIYGGGCSCGGARTSEGPFGTLDQALASLSEYEREELEAS